MKNEGDTTDTDKNQQEPSVLMPGRRRKKKPLKQFVMLSKIELDEKTREHYAQDDETNEFYMITRKCRQCSAPLGEIDGSTSTTSTSSMDHQQQQRTKLANKTSLEQEGQTTASILEESKTSLSTIEECLNGKWLSEKDYEEITVIAHAEQSHQRRHMIEAEEVKNRRLHNKISALDAIKLQAVTRAECDKRIKAAMEEEKASVNINAFLILQDGSLRPYNQHQRGHLYELIHNKHQPQLLTRQHLFMDMIQHPYAFKQLLYIFHYLERLSPRPVYLIYKRPIELLDLRPIDTLDFWDRLEHLFDSKKTGYYYAIIVCLALSINNDSNGLPTKEITLS